MNHLARKIVHNSRSKRGAEKVIKIRKKAPRKGPRRSETQNKKDEKRIEPYPTVYQERHRHLLLRGGGIGKLRYKHSSKGKTVACREHRLFVLKGGGRRDFP